MTTTSKSNHKTLTDNMPDANPISEDGYEYLEETASYVQRRLAKVKDPNDKETFIATYDQINRDFQNGKIYQSQAIDRFNDLIEEMDIEHPDTPLEHFLGKQLDRMYLH